MYSASQLLGAARGDVCCLAHEALVDPAVLGVCRVLDGTHRSNVGTACLAQRGVQLPVGLPRQENGHREPFKLGFVILILQVPGLGLSN